MTFKITVIDRPERDNPAGGACDVCGCEGCACDLCACDLCERPVALEDASQEHPDARLTPLSPLED